MEFAPRMSRFKPSPSQIASARVRDLIAEGRDIVNQLWKDAGRIDAATVVFFRNSFSNALIAD